MENKVDEDFLTVDQQIPGQNYVCLSFISPEKIILEKQKFEHFKYLEYILNNENELNELKKNLSIDNYSSKLEDFNVANKNTLKEEFENKVDFQTNIRGVKIRGTYETEKEAKVRAEILRRRFPNDNVFIGQVGYWLPWDPNPLDVQNLEYQETELNTLMKKYNENMEYREHMFDEERRTKLDKAKKENEQRKKDEENNIQQNTVEYDEEHREKFQNFREILNEKDALMNSGDPWLQRKEEEKINNKQENNEEDLKTEEECELKDENVEQEIEINYSSDKTNDDVNKDAKDNDSKLDPEPE